MVFMRDLTAAEILSLGASDDATEAALDWACGDGRDVRRMRRLDDGGISVEAIVGDHPSQTFEFTSKGGYLMIPWQDDEGGPEYRARVKTYVDSLPPIKDVGWPAREPIV